jgi:hypothetical protein
VRIHHNKNTGSEYGVTKVPENVGLIEKVICLHHTSLEEQTKRRVVIEIFYKERCLSLLNLSFPTGLLGTN